VEQEEAAVARQWCGKHVSAARIISNNRGTVGSNDFYLVLAKAT
jgi:hypothetical protein